MHTRVEHDSTIPQS